MLDLGLPSGLEVLLLLLNEGGMLPFRPLRPDGAGFMANSCAPGVGGVKKDEDGDGKGDEMAGFSRETDKRDARRNG